MKLLAHFPEFDDTIILQNSQRLMSGASFIAKNKSSREVSFNAYFLNEDQFEVTPSSGILKPESSRNTDDNLFGVSLKPSRYGKYSSSVLIIEVT